MINIDTAKQAMQPPQISNSLISTALPLIILIIRLRDKNIQTNVDSLRKKIILEIRQFEARALERQYDKRTILAARYCLCTVLDEIVLLSQWGQESDWSQQTLLNIIQKETWGGERFFLILEKMLETPAKNLAILELIYFLLILGFEGKYYDQEKHKLKQVQTELYKVIQRLQPELEMKLHTPLALPESSSKSEQNYRKPYYWAVGIFVGFFCLANIATYVHANKVFSIFHTLSSSLGGYNSQANFLKNK